MESRVWTSLLLGGVCGVLPVLGWRLLGSPGPEGIVRASERAEASRAGAPLIPPPGARRSSLADASSPPRAAERSLPEFRQLLDTSVPANQMRYLHELVALGTPEALDLLFERLNADPDAFGSESIWELLFELDDPRVYELARARFERALAEDLSGGRYMTGYLKLIASHGGSEGADLILSQVITEGRVRSREAAYAIGYLRDHSNSDVYLAQLMVSDGRNQRIIGRALAHWDEPHVTEELYAIARSSDVNDVHRRSILQGFGENARDAAAMDAVFSHYWAAGDDASQVESAFSGLQSLQTNRFLDRDLVAKRTFDVLHDVLGSESWFHGVQLVANHAHLRTPEIKAALEALLGGLQDPEERAIVKMELLKFL